MNKEDALLKLKYNGEYYYELPFCLQNDKDCILRAIKTSPDIFQNLSDSKKDEEEIVIAAITHKPLNFRYISKRLRQNDDINKLMFLNGVNINLIHEMDADYDCHKSIIKVFIRKNMTPKGNLIKNKHFMLKIIKKQSYYLDYCSKDMLDDKSFLLKLYNEVNIEEFNRNYPQLVEKMKKFQREDDLFKSLSNSLSNTEINKEKIRVKI